MVRRKSLSDQGVKRLPRRATRYTHPDPELRGHYVRVPPAGTMSFVAVARDPAQKRKQVWATIGPADGMEIEAARVKAREAIARIKAGLAPFPPLAPAPETFAAVAGNYLTRHVKARGLRSQGEIERCLARYIPEAWKARDFASIKRSQVAKLLDAIQDDHGARQADAVLAIVRGIMRWHASRGDDYRCPVAGDMRRTDPKGRKRGRVLDDAELRLVWDTAETSGTFGAIVRLALLTAQRREKIAGMRWADVSLDGVWSVPGEDREKGNGGVLQLPDAAAAIVRAQNRIDGNEHVFPGRGEGHFVGFSPCKRTFDAKVLKARRAPAVATGEDPATVAAWDNWTVHDLRRTARTLMARAGVLSEIAERVLGHVQGDLIETYNRHGHAPEKADALKRLAALIENIVHPPGDNVAMLDEHRQAAQRASDPALALSA